MQDLYYIAYVVHCRIVYGPSIGQYLLTIPHARHLIKQNN